METRMGLFTNFFNRAAHDEPLHCPRDKTALAREDMFDISLHRCPECDGRWLPSAQAPKFFKRMADPEKALREFQQQVEHHSQQSSARCAKDGAPMRYFTQRGVTLDVCTQCRSIWFDGDELGQFLVSNPEGGANNEQTDKPAGAAASAAGSATADTLTTTAMAVGAVEVAATLFDLFS
jgi:Zn-finger nucleic acid-binding protein